MSDKLKKNDDLTVEVKSNYLQDIRIALCGGGGIAAIELPRIARELRRHGASVRCVVTQNCLRFIGKESLEWATGQEVIVEPSGFAEHIAGAETIVVIPATADLLSKFTHGICCDGVTTLVQSAFGNESSVIICPTMHWSLAASPFVAANKKLLSELPNVNFVNPRKEEGKEKAPDPVQFALEVCHLVNKRRNFSGHKVTPHALVTMGGTRSLIDPVRCLTNLSSGELGKTLSLELYANGINVTVFEANVSQPTTQLQHLNVISTKSFDELKLQLEAVDAKKYSAIFHVAAVSDYTVKNAGNEKISSSTNELNIVLEKTPKLHSLKNLSAVPFKSACKLTTDKNGLQIAENFFSSAHLSTLVWNTASDSFDGKYKATILSGTSDQLLKVQVGSKKEAAQTLVKQFMSFFAGTPLA